MRRFTQQRRRAYSLRMRENGKKSQAVQAALREAAITDDERQEMAANPPLLPGGPIRVLEWRNLQTGKILRWAVLRGPRSNNYILRSLDGRKSRPHGMAWILEHLRHMLLTH